MISLCSDSQLVVSLIKGEYQSREPLLQRYLAKVKESLLGLSKFEIKHIPREENSCADLLSKLASTKSSSTLKSMVEEVLPSPCAILQVEIEDWRTPIVEYITKGSILEDPQEAKKLVQKASRYTVIEGQLFRRGLSTPLLKCIGPSETWYVLTEVHEESCGHHIGGKSLERKSLRAGYFWPTMNKDAAEHVKKCQKCQEHNPISHIPAEALHSIFTPWPFHTWALDLLVPFTPTTGFIPKEGFTARGFSEAPTCYLLHVINKNSVSVYMLYKYFLLSL
jgi:hypothetical protein